MDGYGSSASAQRTTGSNVYWCTEQIKFMKATKYILVATTTGTFVRLLLLCLRPSPTNLN